MRPKNKVCPACRENGHDSKGDHLFLAQDDKTWICTHKEYHKDGKFYREDNGLEILSGFLQNQQQKREESSIQSDYTDSVGEHRKIKKEYFDEYGCEGHYDSGGELQAISWGFFEDGKEIGKKTKKLHPKDFFSTSVKGAKLEFFGQQLYNKKAKRLIITEGEFDALATRQMLSSQKYPPAVVSLPIGAEEKALRVFSDQQKWLTKFEQLILIMDNDKAGEKTEGLIYGINPDIMVVSFSENDPLDMLKEGKEQEFVSAVYGAEKWKPSCMVSVEDVLEEAIDPVIMGLDYPFQQLTDKTYGSRGGQLICVVGAPGSGKTTFLKQLKYNFVDNHNLMIGDFDLENTPGQTLKHLIGGKMNLPIHLPDCIYDRDEAKRIGAAMAGMIHFYDHRGYREWKDIMMYMRYLYALGYTRFFIDPLSALTVHLSASDANTYISAAMMDMSKFIQEAPDVQIFHCNHANNSTGKDAGAGGRIYGGQITGSRAQWRFSTDVWSIERDQTADDEIVRSTVNLRIIKNRLAGNTGTIELMYDKNSGCLKDKVSRFSI